MSAMIFSLVPWAVSRGKPACCSGRKGNTNHKRGRRPGPQAVPDNRLTNNLILTKLESLPS